jgi:peptidyl-prolyl cis-trans isomerase A (cyclophilin A)
MLRRAQSAEEEVMSGKRCGMIVSCFVLIGMTAAGLAQEKPGAPKPAVVALETTMGTIKIELNADKAPITCKNFLDYVNAGFYDGLLIQRVDFVIQSGGYTEQWTVKPTRPPIQNESKNGLKNVKGSISMARYDDPNSATSQFFINLEENTHLDPSGSEWGYAVFAKVIAGMDVVEKIGKVKTDTKSVQGTPFPNVPVETIVLKTAKVVSQ